MNSWAKLLVGGALLWYGVLRGVKGLVAKVYSYSFRSINFSDLSVSLNLNISVKNPLFVGLQLKGVMGDVFVQGHKVGSANTSYNYYLSGGKTHIIPVVVTLNLADVGQAALLNIQSGDVRTLQISFDGKLFVSNNSIGVPLQFDLDYNDLVK